MKITLGKEGLCKTWQAVFPKVTKCVYCGETARIGFVAHEGIDPDDVYNADIEKPQFVAHLHSNKEHSEWLHDCCCVAVYFCKECLKPTALYNQG